MVRPALKPLIFSFWVTIIGFLLILVTGCVVGPNYTAPETSLPESWNNTPQTGDLRITLELDHWWESFGDPTLSNLVQQGLEGSLDIRSAMARMDEARAQLGIELGQRLPSAEVDASYERGRRSENTGMGSTRLADMPNIATDDTDNYSLGLGAAWELDLFGRIRRSVEAGKANLQATVEDYRGVRVALSADIATAYLEISSLQQRIDIAKSNISAQEKTLDLVRMRYDAGLAPGLELAQAEANLASTRSSLPPLQDSLEHTLNRLCILLGKKPGALRETIENSAAQSQLTKPLSIGFPADLLRRRPDIRRAERLLAAQTARVGIATADLYPRFSLLGNIGYASLDASSLFNSGSLTYGVGPKLSWNIFNGGRVRSAIDVEDARVEQALAGYEKTVLIALAEVEGTLSAYQRETERNSNLVKTVAAYKRSVSFAEELYKGGETDFQNVLDSQRSLLVFEDLLAQSDVSLMNNVISLYRAVGGGWDWEKTSGDKNP